jgi:hypothetical protein
MHANPLNERIDRFNLSMTRSISGKRKQRKKESRLSKSIQKKNLQKLLEYARLSMKCAKNWKNDTLMVFSVGNSIDSLVILSIQARSNICSKGVNSNES